MEEVREKISKILIKWQMPTRQVAINELMQLIQEERRKAKEEGKQEMLKEMLEVYEY